FLIPLKLPLVPCSSNNCKFTTMRLTVSTTMTYVHVGNKNWNMVDSFEVIHTIVVCDIAFTTEQVQYRSMNFLKLILSKPRHSTHSGIWRRKNTAIEYSDSCQSWISCNFKSLKATAGHTTYSNFLNINLVVERTIFITVLCYNPVNSIKQLLGSRPIISGLIICFRHWSVCNHDKSVRSYFRKEVKVFPWRICTSTITPGNNRKLLLIAKRS